MEPLKNTHLANTHQSADVASFFEKDSDFLYVFKKTEKLVKAVYLISNLFPETEPMRLLLRGRSADLLSYAIGYKDSVGSQRIEFVTSVRTRVLEIVSCLEVAAAAGLVSPMNMEILRQEFSKLATVFDMQSPRSEMSVSVLSPDFFNHDSGLPDSSHSKASVVSSVQHEIQNSQYAPSGNSIKDKRHVLNGNAFKKNTRQEVIMDLLSKNKELTIKDISEVIRDCSEKTIQRELIGLIAAKVIKKTGERRWSRYSLISRD